MEKQIFVSEMATERRIAVHEDNKLVEFYIEKPGETGMVGNIYIRGANGQNDNVGVVTATAFIPSSGQLSHRNIIINGAMLVAQRGVSSVSYTHLTLPTIYSV